MAGVSAYFAHEASEEQRSVDLEGLATINSLGQTAAGYGVRVSLINGSLRPIIVRSIVLVVDGVRVAGATSYIKNAAILEDATRRHGQPFDDARTLPFTINARTTETIAAFLNLGSATEGLYLHEHLGRVRGGRILCRAATFAGPSRITEQHEILLRVSTTPGGETNIPLTVTGPGDGGNAWFTSLHGPAAAPNGLQVRRKLAENTARRVITVRIWRNRGGLVRRVRRPSFGPSPVNLPFRRLRRGHYRALVFDGSHIVAGGRFTVPLRGVYDRNVAVREPYERRECGKLLGSWLPRSGEYRRVEPDGL